MGEIWFELPEPSEPSLLVKYLFTSERLSIQVHPDDQIARSLGYRHGKDEAWIVLGADAGAVIGIGLVHSLSSEELRTAIHEGHMERLVDWHPVSVGDVYYAPAGTIHAIGAGLTVLEVQQNLDLTYRLYDYGRPRELHIEDGLRAAHPRPYTRQPPPTSIAEGRELLVSCGVFSIVRWRGPVTANLETSPNTPTWLIPTKTGVAVNGVELAQGSVWLSETCSELEVLDGGELIVAAPGSE